MGDEAEEVMMAAQDDWDSGRRRVQRTRERELGRKTAGRLASTFELSVTGVSFVPTWPGNLYELERLNFDAEAQGERLAAVFLRNPDNAHDPNAVQIHVPALGTDLAMIGHVPAPLAKRLAPELDADIRWQGEVSWVKINHDHPERPGITVVATRKD